MKTKKSVFLIYGEQTVTISFKVPESKRDEIIAEIRDNVLSKYENPKRIDVAEKEDEQISQKNIASTKPNSEKKSNPADIKFKKTTAESYNGEKVKSLLIEEVAQFAKPNIDLSKGWAEVVKDRPATDFYDIGKNKVVEKELKVSVNKEKKVVDMDSLRSIANDEQVKSKVTALYDLPKGGKVEKKSTAKQYDYIKSLPLGTELVKAYGSKGALRKAGNEFFTKRMFDGKIEIIRHESESIAFEYAETNFK